MNIIDMNDRINDSLRKNIDAICVLALMLCIFSYIMFVIKEESDLLAHASIAKEMLEEHRLFSTNFLMYFLVNLLTLFSGADDLMRMVLVLLISLANTAKYVIVREAFKEWTTEHVAKLSSVALLFVYVVPLMYFLKPFGIFLSAQNMYLGYYVPNVWHNSTILCMMPFAIACYLLSVKQFSEYSEKRNWLITILLTISVLVKPSFFFVYACAFPIIMLSKYGFNKELFRSLIPLLFGGLCLAYEYLTIYYNGGNDNSSVVIDIVQLFTLDFWKAHILYLAVSLFLPILFISLYWRSIIHDREFWFVLIMIVIGLGMMWCCKETGPRATHGNFNWQAIAAMWFVYFYILKKALRNNEEYPGLNRGGYSQYIIISSFCIHVVMGMVYLVKFIVTSNFG